MKCDLTDTSIVPADDSHWSYIQSFSFFADARVFFIFIILRRILLRIHSINLINFCRTFKDVLYLDIQPQPCYMGGAGGQCLGHL